MIILSAVTISVVLGDNGLIKQAKKTKNIAEDSIESEIKELNKIEEEYANYMATNTEIPLADLRSEIEKARDEGTVFNTKTSLSDINGNEVVVPEGFKIAEDTGITIQDGVVIEDVNASSDVNVQGSQYVWIPVGRFIKDNGSLSNEIILGRYTFEEDGTSNLVQAAYTKEIPDNYLNQVPINTPDNSDDYFVELSEYREGIASDGEDGINATAHELSKWIDSVKENGGYYIGRYEASFASGTSMENYKAASKVSTNNSIDAMSYTKGTLWNFVTQLNASKVSINTYADSTSVKSDLMNSYAWDTAVVYIQEAKNINYAYKCGHLINSNLTNTGTKQDEVCKINDMASNIQEYTTEYFTAIHYRPGYHCVRRGGRFNIVNNNIFYTINRNGNDPVSVDNNIGFRIIIY